MDNLFLKNLREKKISHYFKNRAFQCFLIGFLTLLISYIIVLNGALPKKYKLSVGMISLYDITAPRNIENTVLTEERARKLAESVPPVIIKNDNVTVEVLNSVDDFFYSLENIRSQYRISKNAQSKVDENILKILEEEIEGLNLSISLSQEQIRYLIAQVEDDKLASFRRYVRELVGVIMTKEVTRENISSIINPILSELQNNKELNQELKDIGISLLNGIVKPNSEIDNELTEAKRKEVYENALKNNKVIVEKGSRIVSVNEVVTEDKMQMLRELNLIETDKIDYIFALGIFVLLVFLTLLLVLFINMFFKKVLATNRDVIVMCLIIVMMLIIARFTYLYSSLLIPFSLATMLLAILIDKNLAIVVNFTLAVAISVMVQGDFTFLYMALISGTFTAFLVSKAHQRIALSTAGLISAGINVLVIVAFGLINKNELKSIAYDSLTVFANGIISAIITIGMLPIWESAFNLITPFKLMELANPNHPLLKRLLMEAPGTYHHSLMVGNLAEVAVESIGGNPLLARVGAYYHDIGKLKRPNFFKENQISENPHDRMSPSLSAAVIISHVQDGVKLAEKYKLPRIVQNIIAQHHGTTLVTYFYHKAKKENQQEWLDEKNFRYPWTRPSSREAAVVMLADSVEAAVRSMTDRTESKIKEVVTKIIKDKLEDRQLNSSELTLNDLEKIVNSFMKVFSGFFHAREQYPDIKINEEADKGNYESNDNGETNAMAHNAVANGEKGGIENG